MNCSKDSRRAVAASSLTGGIAGEDGQDKVEASHDQNRRWYHLRPKPRSSSDFMGINRSWWTVLLVILLIL